MYGSYTNTITAPKVSLQISIFLVKLYIGHDSRCMYMVLNNIQLNTLICVATHITDHIFVLSYQQDIIMLSYINLNIIELAIYLSMHLGPCVLNWQLLNSWWHRHKIAGYVRVRIIMNRWFVFVFLAFNFLKLLRVCKPCGRRSRLARAEPCHWSEGRHNNVGVSLRERRATKQVMLGVSLRAIWDANLVNIIEIDVSV